MTNNIFLLIVGLAAACCFFGAAAYFLSLSNEIKNSKNKKTKIVEYLNPID